MPAEKQLRAASIRLGGGLSTSLAAREVDKLVADDKVPDVEVDLRLGVLLELGPLGILGERLQVLRLAQPVGQDKIVVGNGPSRPAQVILQRMAVGLTQLRRGDRLAISRSQQGQCLCACTSGA